MRLSQEHAVGMVLTGPQGATILERALQRYERQHARRATAIHPPWIVPMNDLYFRLSLT
jgi:hypothetical protein